MVWEAAGTAHPKGQGGALVAPADVSRETSRSPPLVLAQMFPVKHRRAPHDSAAATPTSPRHHLHRPTPLLNERRANHPLRVASRAGRPARCTIHSPRSARPATFRRRRPRAHGPPSYRVRHQTARLAKRRPRSIRATRTGLPRPPQPPRHSPSRRRPPAGTPGQQRSPRPPPAARWHSCPSRRRALPHRSEPQPWG